MLTRLSTVAGAIRVLGVPVKLSESAGVVRTPPPSLGQHTDHVLQDLLGLDESARTRLREAGAI